MVEHIKRIGKHPATSWIGGISLGAVLAFAIVLGGYKNSFDVLTDDMKIIKTDVKELSLNMVMVKTTLHIPIK